jgi:hypothetical protein
MKTASFFIFPVPLNGPSMMVDRDVATAVIIAIIIAISCLAGWAFGRLGALFSIPIALLGVQWLENHGYMIRIVLEVSKLVHS